MLQGIKRGVLFVLCCALLFGCLLSGCAPAGFGKSFVIGQNGLPASLDPQLESGRGGASLCSAIYASLLRADAAGNLLPDCAERYEVSADKKTYTFYLRQGLVWSDGRALSSADFAFGLQRCLTPELGSAIANELLCIEGAAGFALSGSGSLGLDSTDPSVLVIRLSHADAGLPAVLATPYTAPCNEEFFLSTGGRYGLSLDTTLTNGRFTPVSMGNSIVAKKNRLFYDADNVAPKSVTFVNTAARSAETLVENLKDGDLDYALSESIPDEASDKVVATSLKGSVWVLSFSDSDTVAAMPSLRRMLALGGLSLAQAENGAGYFLPPQYRQLVLEGAGTFLASDNTAARTALGETLTLLKKKSLPKVTLLVPEREDARALSDALVENWQQELGVYISREFLSQEELAVRMKQGDYQIALSLFSPSVTSPASFYAALFSAYPLSGDFQKNYQTALTKNSGNQAGLSRVVEKMLLSNDRLYPLAYGQTYFLKSAAAKDEIFHPDSGIIDIAAAKK